MAQQWTAVVDRYAVASHANLPGPIAAFVAAMAPRHEDRLLDACCGPGNLTAAFAPQVRSYVGVDFIRAALHKATARAAEAGLDNVRFEQRNALELGFEPGSFDVVINRLALHHIQDPGAAIREWTRVLVPGGRLGVFDMVTSEDPDEARQHDALETLRDPSHVRTLALSGLFRALGNAGLESQSLAMIDHEFDVDDWMMHCEQTEEQRGQAYAVLGSALGTTSFLGKRVRRDSHDKLRYRVRWAIAVATKPTY